MISLFWSVVSPLFNSFRVTSRWPGSLGCHQYPVTPEWAADLQLSRSCHFLHTHLTGTWPLSVTVAQGREGHCRTSVPKINDRPSLSVFLIAKTVSLDLCPTATTAFLTSLKNFSVPLPLSLTINLFFNWIPFSSVPPLSVFNYPITAHRSYPKTTELGAGWGKHKRALKCQPSR